MKKDMNLVRTLMPFAGFVFIIVLFAILTGGQLYTIGNLKLQDDLMPGEYIEVANMPEFIIC